MMQTNTNDKVTANAMEILLRTRDRMPILYNRVIELLNIVHEPKISKADDVEYKVIDNLRNMGKESLTAWAVEQEQYASNQTLQASPELKCGGKKNYIGIQHTEKSSYMSKY